jgi:hypothetical protein
MPKQHRSTGMGTEWIHLAYDRDQWWEHCEHYNEPPVSKTKMLLALLTLSLPAGLDFIEIG